MRLGILISGRGSNFEAIANSIARGKLDAEIVIVISNRPNAPGLEIARERGIPHIVDGYNRDDEGDWRPGRAAAREHDVRSPLYEAGMRKADVRALARKLGLEVWDKPALACLSSRFPYGTPITLELLRQVDRAEQAVHDAGLRACRVRHHGEIARIEVPPEDIAAAADPERRARIVDGVRAAGYRYVTLDLGGYVSGEFNRSV